MISLWQQDRLSGVLESVENEAAAQQQIDSLLTALARLSVLQTESLPAEQWSDLLARKQVLIDTLTSCDPAMRFRRASALAEQLRALHRTEIANELSSAVARNHERFTELAANEARTCQQVRATVDRLRDHLVSTQRQRNVCQTYRLPSPTPTPVYMNRMR